MSRWNRIKVSENDRMYLQNKCHGAHAREHGTQKKIIFVITNGRTDLETEDEGLEDERAKRVGHLLNGHVELVFPVAS